MNNMKYKRIVDIDGVRVSVTDTGWFLIRASNTSPYLSIRAEGKDEAEKGLMLDKVREALESVEIVNLEASF
jgi:phosphomannomutase